MFVMSVLLSTVIWNFPEANLSPSRMGFKWGEIHSIILGGTKMYSEDLFYYFRRLFFTGKNNVRKHFSALLFDYFFPRRFEFRQLHIICKILLKPIVCYREQHKIDGNTRWEEDAQADIKGCVFFKPQTFSFVLFAWDLRVGFMGTNGPSNLLVRFIAVCACVLQWIDNMYEIFFFLWKLYICHNLFYCPSLFTS